jgi:hypothetical protein
MAAGRPHAGPPLAACAALLGITLLLVATPTARACDNEAEKRLLLDSKLQLDPDRKALVSWTDTTCPCPLVKQPSGAESSSVSTATWRGISCEDGRVTEINFSDIPAGGLVGGLLQTS